MYASYFYLETMQEYQAMRREAHLKAMELQRLQREAASAEDRPSFGHRIAHALRRNHRHTTHVRPALDLR